jgi:DNA-binding helix-hairpin-helix protein with protein kinase domain
LEKQPTKEELEAARERARADAEERYAYETSGREPEEQPGEAGPYAYAPEDVQAEYARVYEATLAQLRRPS